MNQKFFLATSFILLFIGVGAIGGSIFFAVNHFFLNINIVNLETQGSQKFNEIRMQDLKTIQTALKNIYKDFNAYPISQTITNLNNKDTEVNRQLLKYLKDIPRDPNDPKFFYGYYSPNGEQYELTAVQEKNDSYKIYFITQDTTTLKQKK